MNADTNPGQAVLRTAVCPRCSHEFLGVAYMTRCPYCLEELEPPQNSVQRRGQYRKRRRTWTFPHITARTRRGKIRTVGDRDGWICHVCGEPVDQEAVMGTWGFATLDHIVPRSKGGPNANENLKLAHAGCNEKRGAP